MRLEFQAGEKSHSVVLNEEQRKTLIDFGCVALSSYAKRRFIKKIPEITEGKITAGGAYNVKLQDGNLMVYHFIKSL